VAQQYFQDGSVDDACEPLKALLHIMAHGGYLGKKIGDPEIRGMFTRDYLLASDWYQQRLEIKQQRDSLLWQQHKGYIQQQLAALEQNGSAFCNELAQKLQAVECKLAEINGPGYLRQLQGTLGADWVHL
jgi:hypothetical protein